MKKIAATAVLFAVMILAIPAASQAVVSASVTGNVTGGALGNALVSSFYLSIGDYNRVPEREITVVKQQGIPDEELPVVFYLAAKAKVPHAQIVSLRLQKWNWMRIALKYKLDPAIFNVPVKSPVKSRVYGRLYKNYQGNQKVVWTKTSLADEDIVNSVNLRLVSDYYGYSPEEVIRMREQGRDFIKINNDVKTIRVKKGWRPRFDIEEGNDEAEGFYTALSDYNMVRPWEISQARKQGITDEELPVVFFIAANAGVPYGDIVNLRLKKWNWMRIARKYGLSPEVFFVPVNERIEGRVFGRIYGYFAQIPQEKWNRIQLADDEIINFVNLRFMSDYYGFAPEEIIRMRESGRDFIMVNNDVYVITSRKSWGQKDRKYRERHDRNFKYDRNAPGYGYNEQDLNEHGRDNQGFKGKDFGNKQGANYQDLDDKNYQKDDRNEQDNGNQNNNDQGWNNNGRNKNNRVGHGKNDNDAPVAQVTAATAQATVVSGQATAIAAQATAVSAQATAVAAQATAVQVPGTTGQDQGNNGQGRDDKGPKDKGNNGNRNHGAGNDKGIGNEKHENR